MYSQSKQGMALAVAHRICGGNHTFHSGRPGDGRYFAVTPLEVITLPNARIKERMEACQTLRQAVEVQLECCIQSDRIGLAANSVLPRAGSGPALFPFLGIRLRRARDEIRRRMGAA